MVFFDVYFDDEFDPPCWGVRRGYIEADGSIVVEDFVCAKNKRLAEQSLRKRIKDCKREGFEFSDIKMYKGYPIVRNVDTGLWDVYEKDLYIPKFWYWTTESPKQKFLDEHRIVIDLSTYAEGKEGVDKLEKKLIDQGVGTGDIKVRQAR